MKIKMPKKMQILSMLLLGSLTLAGCATTIPSGAVGFRVDSNVNDATVWVDDILVGKVSDWAKDGKHIRAGFHRIEIRHPGYYSIFKEVELEEGARTVVSAPLRPLVE
jgi:hypothetical protein